MAKKLGIKLGEWLYTKQEIQEEQVDDICYAFEILCSECLQFIIIILYGFLNGKWTITIVYLLLFRILRSNFQGYHANTIWKCFILTIGSYLFTMSCYTLVSVNLGFVILSILLVLPIQFGYCKSVSKWTPIITLVLLHSVGFLFLFLRYPMYLQVLLIVNALVSISLLPKREERN